MRNDGKPNTIQYLVPFSQSHSANLAWGRIMLYLRSPMGGCCSISDDLSCSSIWMSDKICIFLTQNFAWSHETIMDLIHELSCVDVIHTPWLYKTFKHCLSFVNMWSICLRRQFWNRCTSITLLGKQKTLVLTPCLALGFEKCMHFFVTVVEIYCGWLYFRGYQFSWIEQKWHIRGVQNSWS